MMSACSLVVIVTLCLLRGCSCSAVPSGSVPGPSGSGPAPSGSGPEPSGSIPAPSGSGPAPSGSVPAPSGSVPAPSGSGPAPSGSVPAPSGSGPAPSGSGPAPSGSVPAPSGSVPAPSGSVPAPSGSVPAPSGSGPAPSGSGPAPSGSGPAPSGSGPAPSGSVPAPSGSVPAPSGSVPAPSGSVPAPSGSPAPPLRPRGFRDTTEDYDDFSDEPLVATPPSPTHRPAARLCDYDVCRENQTPCARLAAASGCFCPGVSPHSDPPEPPVLKSVSSSSEGEGGGAEGEGGGVEATVTVRWCAPYSSVGSYVVTVGGEDRAEFGKDRRSGAFLPGEMTDPATARRVCVVALNDRGRSAEVAESCTMYRPERSSASSWLKAGLIGGALGLLVLLALALLLWRQRRRRRKAQATISS